MGRFPLSLVVISVCLGLTFSQTRAPKRRAPAQPASTALEKSRPEGEMSPAFREQAHRALDAIWRVPRFAAADNPKPGFEVRKLDAEKAVVEAKYKAHTVKDREILRILEVALLGLTAAGDRSAFDTDWKKLQDVASQCITELHAELEPEVLSEVGRRTAQEKTCIKQMDSIMRAWQR